MIPAKAPIALFLGGFAMGCTTSKGTDAGGSDSGSDAGACPVKNPDGVCCPTSNVGSATETRIDCSMQFDGYLNLDPKTKTASTGPLVKIRLSDFYDPDAKKYRVIRILAGASWCGPCRMENQYISMPGGSAEKFEPLGVVFLYTLLESTMGMAPTQMDLSKWITDNSANITEMLDPSAAQIGVFKPAGSVPFSITIDARSMVVKDVGTGFSTGSVFDGEVQKWLDWTMQNPPQK